MADAGMGDGGDDGWRSGRRLAAGVGLGAGASMLAVLAALGQPLWPALAPALVAAAVAWFLAPASPPAPGAPKAGPAATPAAPAQSPQPAMRLPQRLPVPVIVLDGDGVVEAATDSALARFSGLTVGRPVSLGLRDPDFLAAIADAAADRADLTLNSPGEDGTSWRVRFARDGARLYAAFEDLAEQRATERLRVDFIANASHELRTPLASLLGFIETLQGPARDDAVARGRFLGIMREQAGRMARLIDDLLSLSRAELRAHQPPAGRTDLALAVREIAESLGMSARERGVTLSLDVPASPVTIRADRDDMLRLCENLIENAIKYGRDGKSVEVSLTAGPEAVRLSVRDHGPGIAAQHIPRLTERFYRVDASHGREVNGTGLGLAIVKHIVARHGAKLDVESRLGDGARFTVVFPVS